MRTRTHHGQVDAHARGFSLVELLVALLFTALLIAGMAQVFTSSVKTFHATGEVIGTQATSRWAMDQVNDDISQAGFLFPERTLPATILNGSESLFRIDPDQTVAGVTRRGDADASSVEAETVKADAIQFFTDIPLPVQGTWAADTSGDDPNPEGTATTAPASASVTFTLGSVADLQSGDVEIILDSGENGKWEHPIIKGSPVANPIVFETDATVIANFSSPNVAAGITLAHKKGVPVYFVRPAQLVRYVVQAVSLDPTNTAVKLPCLVRQQLAYPAAGSADWTKAASRIIAENVSGFRVDASFDGGKTWARTGASTWAAIQGNANTQLATSGMSGFTSITNSSNVDWFRTIPCILKLDITTRTAMRREEYSATKGTRDYRTRTQTLMISPRNFGMGK